MAMVMEKAKETVAIVPLRFVLTRRQKAGGRKRRATKQ
jgi:hypothetical protein